MRNMTKPTLTQLERAEIPLGTALSFPLFDAQGTLLCGEGDVILLERDLNALLDIGLFRHPQWRDNAFASDDHAQKTSAASPPENFAALQLARGDVLHICRNAAPPVFDAVSLVDWIANREVRVSAINQLGQTLQYETGAPLEIKLLAGQYIVAFESWVLHGEPADSSCLSLHYPEQIRSRKLRKSLRSAVELDVMVSSPHNSVCYDAILDNLSASGGLFELPQLCAARGDKIHLTLSLPETGSMPLTAEVRNLHTSNNNGIPVIQYGIEFCDLAATEHALLEHFIFKSLLDSEL